jgi:hypothetical protein
LNRIKARPKQTGESWIAGIFTVLNPVKPAGSVPLCAIAGYIDNVKSAIIKWRLRICSINDAPRSPIYQLSNARV